MMRSMLGWWAVRQRRHTLEVWVSYYGFSLDQGEVGDMTGWCRANLRHWELHRIDNTYGLRCRFSFAEKGDLVTFSLVWSEHIATLKRRYEKTKDDLRNNVLWPSK